MQPTAKLELRTILVLIVIFTIFAMYSISCARANVRDDLRMQDITNIKRSLEQYYNEHEFYISSPTGTTGCTTSSTTSWLFGNASALLREQFIDAIPHDVRESRGLKYSYCVTSTKGKKADGFYLQASMEGNKKDGKFFDEDEQRKFDYRILTEKGQKLYRVCGGEEKQCK